MITLKFNAKFVRLNKASMYFYTGNANELVPIIGRFYEQKFLSEFSELIPADYIAVINRYDNLASLTPPNQSTFNLESLIIAVEAIIKMHISRTLMLFQFQTYVKLAVDRIKAMEKRDIAHGADVDSYHSN